MRRFCSCLRLLCLLALLWSATFAIAQDEGAISIVGSKIMSELLISLAEVADIDSVNITAQGTSKGIDRFCNGNTDIAIASRAISSAEEAICLSNDVVHSEFLFAHKIVAFAAHSGVSLSCLPSTGLENLYKPSSSNQPADWSDFDQDADALPIAMLVPQTTSLEYTIVDSQIVGDLLRSDVETYGALDEAVARAGATDGSLAILPLMPDLAADESIQTLEISSDQDSDCVQPSAKNVESDLYPFAHTYYLYVNRARLADNETLADFVQALISRESADDITDLGFTPPTSETYDLNDRIFIDPDSTLSHGGGETEFEIPPELSGEIKLAGSANAYQLLERVSSRLPGEGAQLQVKIDAVGRGAGIANLCAGDIDIAIIDTLPQMVDIGSCDASEIPTVSIDIGVHATVLLGNEADRHTECLTLEQVDAIWNASSTNTIKAWHEIDMSMPHQDMTLFGLISVDRYADILLRANHDTAPPIRRDTEQDFDPLYRAAAVANVKGSLTYMSWPDYQKVLENQQANVRLVSVDAGSGCVLPGVDSIVNGTYPLSRPASLLAKEISLADINVQSLLWSLFADDSWPILEREGFVGIDRADLPVRRRRLETLFMQAESKAASIQDAQVPADGGEETEVTSDQES